ncbi:MAG TPA: carboxypeptidase-like regulatory domain-containing protein [Acidobacteriaceae bacterium]|nr:carboxypeptidase-like regulatory domain-containing protein [Acidobacteriaceae bacterium]
MKYMRIALFVLFAILIATSAHAQSTATLSGVVTDPSGAVVPNAQVKVTSPQTGAERIVPTDREGLYAVPSLQPGDYVLQVTTPGLAPYNVPAVTLSVDQKITLNVKLSLASTGSTVEVQSAAMQIESQTMTVGQVIDRATVQNLPLNGRHFLDLTVLTPGGVIAPTSGNLTSASRGLGANSFLTSGNREDSVNFQINGVNLNDMAQNQITFQPSISTTSEFKINNSTFSAEYGRSSGSIVNVSTRSGTNQFHGEVFDYFRNDALDARNYFNRDFNTATGAPLAGLTGKKAPLKRNNFGVSVGGPVFRNHTFFFGSYEGLRQHQGILQNATVLSNAASTTVNGTGQTVYVPNQRAAIAALNKPVANALLALIPLPNSGNNYVAFTPGPVQIDQGTGDILQHFGQADDLHGFYAFQRDVRTEPTLQYATPSIPGFGDHRNAHRQILTINETHVFSPRVVNEARLGFNRISIAFTPNVQLNPATLGIGDGLNTPIGIPQITLQDLNMSFGGPALFPQGRFDTMGIFSDTATILKGRHTLKVGGEFRRVLNANFGGDTGTLTYATSEVTSTISAADAQTKSQSVCTFASNGTVNPNCNQFANDLAPTFNIQPTTVSSRLYINAAGAFIQDNFKLMPGVTLEGGLRFEWNGSPVEGGGRFVYFDPATVTLNHIRQPYKQNYNLEPRVGFAWDLGARGQTVLRGGYGFLADQPVANAVSGLASNPPYNTSVSYSTSTIPIPVGSLYNSAKASGIALNNINPNFRNGYIESFNFNVQQGLPGSMVASIGYYGSVGRHLRVRTNENQPINGGTRPYLALAASSPIAAGASINSNISEANSIGISNYNALWLTLTKNMTHGLQFSTNYSYSKSMDLNSLGSQGAYVLQDSNNPANNYGLSDFDVRHHFAGTAIYDLPFMRNNRLLGGFRLSTIMQYQTGNPVNITSSSMTYTGVAGVIRPNLVGPISTMKQQRAGTTNVQFIQSTNTCTTTITTGCTFQIINGIGNIQRNAVTGPGFADLDISGEKQTKIFESLTFTLRADAFDILNHPNFGQPSGNAQSTTFGQISATRFATSDGGSSRQLQISGKFTF